MPVDVFINRHFRGFELVKVGMDDASTMINDTFTYAENVNAHIYQSYNSNGYGYRSLDDIAI